MNFKAYKAKVKQLQSTWKWKLTFTALDVSSVNGGVIPDDTKMSEAPKRTLDARMIDVLAPKHQQYIGEVTIIDSREYKISKKSLYV